MPEYRRAFVPGGTFFFTVVTARRRRFLCTPLARRLLREAIIATRRDLPFVIDAFVLLPDHLHCLWTLPDDDDDYSTRWARIKRTFTTTWLAAGGEQALVSARRTARHDRGVWQPRFWEHTVRDETDLERHMDYIHYNPVRHEYVRCPHLWPYSTFPRHVTLRRYAPDWQCVCNPVRDRPRLDFSDLDETAME